VIRLLKGEATPIETEAAGTQIKYEVKVISTADQARLLDLAQRVNTIEGMHAYKAAVLRTCVQGLVIGGQSVDAGDLADRADLSHQQTLEIVQRIVAEAERVLFPGEETVGKSASQQGQ